MNEMELQVMMLKQAQMELGLNVGEMADKLGVHRETYAKWLHGKRTLPAIGRTLIKLLLEANVNDNPK